MTKRDIYDSNHALICYNFLMYYLEYKYFSNLKILASESPEHFSLSSCIHSIKPQITKNNNLYADPFSNNNSEYYFNVDKKTFFLKGGELGDSMLADFYDIQNEEVLIRQKYNLIYSSYEKSEEPLKKEIPYYIPQQNIARINEILFYDKILDLFSKHYGNPYGMLWLYMWSNQLNLNFYLQNNEHVEGLAFIDGLKETLSVKIKMLTYGILNEKRYHKSKNYEQEDWGDIFNPAASKKNVEIENKKTIPYFHNSGSKYSAYNSNSNKPTAFVLTKNREIITHLELIYNAETVWVEPSKKNFCMECKNISETVEAVKPVHLDETFFLCNNCVKKFNHNNKCLTKILSESGNFEHQMLAAKSLYADSNILQTLAFSESPRIRNEVFLNPNADDVVKTAIKLQT